MCHDISEFGVIIYKHDKVLIPFLCMNIERPILVNMH